MNERVKNLSICGNGDWTLCGKLLKTDALPHLIYTTGFGDRSPGSLTSYAGSGGLTSFWVLSWVSLTGPLFDIEEESQSDERGGMGRGMCPVPV